MKNFAEVSRAFANRKAQEKKILRGAISLKVYEVITEVPTSSGLQIRVDLVKTQSPKQALKLQREKLSVEEIATYEIKTVVSPTPKNGYIAYEVFKNAHIIR